MGAAQVSDAIQRLTTSTGRGAQKRRRNSQRSQPIKRWSAAASDMRTARPRAPAIGATRRAAAAVGCRAKTATQILVITQLIKRDRAPLRALDEEQQPQRRTLSVWRASPLGDEPLRQAKAGRRRTLGRRRSIDQRCDRPPARGGGSAHQARGALDAQSRSRAERGEKVCGGKEQEMCAARRSLPSAMGTLSAACVPALSALRSAPTRMPWYVCAASLAAQLR